jgi:hypothetical protein
MVSPSKAPHGSAQVWRHSNVIARNVSSITWSKGTLPLFVEILCVEPVILGVFPLLETATWG